LRDSRNRVVNKSSDGKVDSSRDSLAESVISKIAIDSEIEQANSASSNGVGRGMMSVASIVTIPIARMTLLRDIMGASEAGSTFNFAGSAIIFFFRFQLGDAEDLFDFHGEPPVDHDHASRCEFGVLEVQVHRRVNGLIEF